MALELTVDSVFCNMTSCHGENALELNHLISEHTVFRSADSWSKFNVLRNQNGDLYFCGYAFACSSDLFVICHR